MLVGGEVLLGGEVLVGGERCLWEVCKGCFWEERCLWEVCKGCFWEVRGACGKCEVPVGG